MTHRSLSCVKYMIDGSHPRLGCPTLSQDFLTETDAALSVQGPEGLEDESTLLNDFVEYLESFREMKDPDQIVFPVWNPSLRTSPQVPPWLEGAGETRVVEGRGGVQGVRSSRTLG